MSYWSAKRIFSSVVLTSVKISLLGSAPALSALNISPTELQSIPAPTFVSSATTHQHEILLFDSGVWYVGTYPLSVPAMPR
jgi:hypothetical protein